MTNQTHDPVSRNSVLEEVTEALEWALNHIGGHCRYDNAQQVVNCLEKSHRALAALRTTEAPAQAEQSSAQVEPVARVDQDDLRQIISDAYQAGCLAVHNNRQEDRDPDFSEAGSDYARSVEIPAQAEQSSEREAKLTAALLEVQACMLTCGDGVIGDFGWKIGRLTAARPMIREALNYPRRQR